MVLLKIIKEIIIIVKIIFLLNTDYKDYTSGRSRTKGLKNQPCDVIKMKEIRGEMVKKIPKKRWIIPHFYDVTRLIF